jgi:Cytidylate kinase-like family
VGYRVLAISPTDGSAGEQLGPVLARKLGFQLVNEEIVAHAAREAGVTPEIVADVEKRKSLLHRLLEGFGEIGPAGAAGFTGYAAIAEDPGPNRDALRGMIRTVLEESADRGNAVIVAHAASLALGDRDDVLRVLITASPETRARRVAEAQGIDEAEAKKVVTRGDANRADYLKRFYDASAELPTHYDLVINTDRITPEDAASLILGAARSERVTAS